MRTLDEQEINFIYLDLLANENASENHNVTTIIVNVLTVRDFTRDLTIQFTKNIDISKKKQSYFIFELLCFYTVFYSCGYLKRERLNRCGRSFFLLC
jgi:hypothetical protein